jgi:hypothetical protein
MTSQQLVSDSCAKVRDLLNQLVEVILPRLRRRLISN